MVTPIASRSITFDVADAAVRPMLTDVSGGATTYGTWTDLPGVQSLQVNPNFITAELKGDAKTLDRRAKTSGFDVNVNYALLDLTVLGILLGGTVVNTDGLVATWELSADASTTPYVQAAFAVNDVSGGLGNIIVCLNKCNTTGGDIFNQQTDQYGVRSLTLSAIPPLALGSKIIKIYFNATLAQISTLIT
jgi:hypothetical protein